MGSKGGGQVSGYQYYFDILMGLCRGPIDQLVAIRVGDLEAWPALYLGDTVNPELPVSQMLTLDLQSQTEILGDPNDSSGTPLTATQRFAIAQPNLFGGQTSEGGIAGTAILLMGGRNQVVPDDVKDYISTGNPSYFYTYDGDVGYATDGNTVVDPTGSDSGTVEEYQYISDFRGVACMWYSGEVCANNPYPKAWKHRVRRAIQGWDVNGLWYPSKVVIEFTQGYSQDIIRGMNPAHIIYQCLTDRNWGRGLPRSRLDESTFIYAANYLYNEGFGLCMVWQDQSGKLDDFIQQVVDHISAVIYSDRSTGLLCLRLVRQDYDTTQIPTFNYASGLISVDIEETASNNVTMNEIIVKWHDPFLDKPRQTRVQNNASIQALGQVISVTRDYTGIPDPDLANRVGLRDLKAGSAGLKKFKLKFDRRAWKLQPGSVFFLQATDKGIGNIIVRTMTYDDGTMKDGTIKIDATQDVFGMPSTVFTTAMPTIWTQPGAVAPQPIVSEVTFEASYYDMLRGLPSYVMSSIDSSEGAIIACAGAPSTNSIGIALLVTPEGGTASQQSIGTFCPVAKFTSNIDAYQTTVQLSKGLNLGNVAAGQAAVIGSECVRVDGIDLTTGIVTIARGCADTLPQIHVAPGVVFFYNSVNSAYTDAYAVGESVGVQILTRTMTGLLAASLAPTLMTTIVGRWALPYNAANLTLNSVLPITGEPVLVSGDAVFAWNSRNAQTQSDVLLGTLEDSVSPPTGLTYTLEVWSRAEDGTVTLLRSHTGITELTYTYSETEADDNADPPGLLFVLYSVLGTAKSFQSYAIPVIHVGASYGGYGDSYGYGYGGPP